MHLSLDGRSQSHSSQEPVPPIYCPFSLKEHVQYCQSSHDVAHLVTGQVLPDVPDEICEYRERTQNQYAFEHETLHSLSCHVCLVALPTADRETVQYADSNKEHYEQNAVERVGPERASVVADYGEKWEAAYEVACRPCSVFQPSFSASDVFDRFCAMPDAW